MSVDDDDDDVTHSLYYDSCIFLHSELLALAYKSHDSHRASGKVLAHKTKKAQKGCTVFHSCRLYLVSFTWPRGRWQPSALL